jgi:hypothetical protein
MGYYFAGRDDRPVVFATPLGIYSVPSWPATIADQNALLEAEFTAALAPGSRRRSSRH